MCEFRIEGCEKQSAIAELKKATTTQWKENQGAFRPSCCRDEPVAEIVY
jgi:hypothetical protein